MPFRDSYIAFVFARFVVEIVRRSHGGHKLSQQALTAIVVLGGEELSGIERTGSEILLSAHRHIWKDQSLERRHRFAVCELLFQLAKEAMRDPLLMLHEPQVPEQRLPDELKRKWYGNLPPEKLSCDVIRAFDDIHEMRKQARKDRDSLVTELIETRKKLEQANLKIWILSLIVSPIIAAIFKAIWAKLFF